MCARHVRYTVLASQPLAKSQPSPPLILAHVYPVQHLLSLRIHTPGLMALATPDPGDAVTASGEVLLVAVVFDEAAEADKIVV